jgi:hypothetical protein
MEHYVPLHPAVIGALRSLFDGKKDEEPLFEYNSFQMWVKCAKISMSRLKGHFVLGELAQVAEQHGGILQWDQSNKAYITTRGVKGIDWKHYKHPLPYSVYDRYLEAWASLILTRQSGDKSIYRGGF